MDDVASRALRSFAFGRFLLIPERRLLLHGEVPVRIGGRALDLLTALVERAGETISKRDLISRAWPTVVVEEQNLKVNMASLRRLLGDNPPAVQFIATVPGRGYRFVAPIRSSALAESAVGQRMEVGPNNLPLSSTRVVGRAAAVVAIQQKLASARLVSIVGPGGVGKTTVALAMAEGALGAFRDGVFLVDLAPVKDPALVPNAVATAIGLTTANSPNMLAALAGHLRDGHVLLVLDSCEHLIGAVAECSGRLLKSTAQVKIIATSREPLAVTGERVLRLPGLDAPPPSTTLSAAEALVFPAVQLFVDRAADRFDRYQLSDTDAPVVAEICRRVDGLALAIELAATQVGTFGVRGLLKQLDGRINLLQGLRAGAERHRTLAATIDWSYELLSDAERMVMRRLSAFAAVFSLESAAAVAADASLAPEDVGEILASLVSKSLLTAEVTEMEAHYRQLDTTRAYAWERLVAGQEVTATRMRHAEHFLQRAERAAADHARMSHAAWMACHGSTIDDLRVALNWACQDSGDARLVVRLTMAALPYWKQLSLVGECRSAVERALDQRFDAARTLQDDLSLHLTLGATLLHTHGPLLEVKASLTKALAIAEQLRDVSLQLECLRGLSEYELWSGDSRSALLVSEQIRTIAKAQQNSAAGVDADAQAGSAFWYLADFSASRRSFESIASRPVPLNLQTDAARSEFSQRITAQGNLVHLLWLQGMADQAVQLSKRQRVEAEASGNAVLQCYALIHGSVVVSLLVRDLQSAGRFLDAGEALAKEHGLAIWRNMATMVRGRWFIDSNQPFDFAVYRETLAEVRGRGFRMRFPNYLTNYGEALAKHGDVDAGLAVIDEAIELARSHGNVVGVPEMLRIKGNALRLKGPGGWDSATDCFAQSIELARQHGGLSWILRTAIDLVEISRERGGNEQAEETLVQTYGQFTEGLETGDLRRARSVIAAKQPMVEHSRPNQAGSRQTKGWPSMP
jgi:predicted ATPase/DNA-binding winged helix-turn-helix (wHTH) protein